MKTHPIMPTPSFSNFLQPIPSPHSPVTSNLTPTVLSVDHFLWLNGWSRHIWCIILLNDKMDLRMSSLGTLVPDGHWCVFYVRRHQVYCSLTHYVLFYWCYDLISHTHTNTQTQTAHLGGSRSTHAYKYIFTSPVLCSQQSPLLY